MKFKGVCVDVDKAHTMKQQLCKQEEQLMYQVKAETGIDVQIWAARSIAKAFDKLSLDYSTTEKQVRLHLQKTSFPIINIRWLRT